MKKIGDYTVRGSVNTNLELNRIILFDGQFDTAYKVVEFKIAPHDMDSTDLKLFTAKLMTDDDAAVGVNWNWDNNEEIGWAYIGYDRNAPQFETKFNLVDPDNLVVEDLYIVADETAGNTDVKMNYFIRMEKYDITDSQGALAMVRNRSQA